MPSLTVEINRVTPNQSDIPLPRYATEGSAGMDVVAAIDRDMNIGPGETVLVPSGFSISLPPGYEAQIRPRSGLAAKHQVGILNSPGTIDSDYRGEVKVILTNFGKNVFIVKRGDRIAQMVVSAYTKVVWKEVDALNTTSRGDGGFGHTGMQ